MTFHKTYFSYLIEKTYEVEYSFEHHVEECASHLHIRHRTSHNDRAAFRVSNVRLLRATYIHIHRFILFSYIHALVIFIFERRGAARLRYSHYFRDNGGPLR